MGAMRSMFAMASMLAGLLGPGSAFASESVPVAEQEIPLAPETVPAAESAQQPETEYGSPFAEVDQYFDAIDRISDREQRNRCVFGLDRDRRRG